jgi:hypothetical protein
MITPAMINRAVPITSVNEKPPRPSRTPPATDSGKTKYFYLRIDSFSFFS